MKLQSTLLTVCLTLIATASGTPTTSSLTSTTRTSSVSTKHSTIVSTKASSSSSKTSTSSSKSATLSVTSVATTYDINFDERTVKFAVPALNAVGIEKSIFFNSWVLIQPTEVNNATVANVIPHSLPNGIVTGFEQQAVNGTPSLTILYLGSTIKTFDLISFYFGCALNAAQGLASVPTQCTILVAGFQNNKEVAVATYTFSPPAGQLAVPMIQAVLPKTFVKLQNLTIIQDNPTLEALLCDDFVVTTHT